MSINQLWPGFVAGEWHNNHHLYPSSARSGFLKHQIDFAWYYIKFMSMIGAVTDYHDSKKLFLEQYQKPYLESKKAFPLQEKKVRVVPVPMPVVTKVTVSAPGKRPKNA